MKRIALHAASVVAAIGCDLAIVPAPAQAQAPSTGGGVSEVVVTGAAAPGAVITQVPLEARLDPRAVRALGVGSLSEVLDELAPQTRGADELAPVVLVNGRPTSSLSEIEDLPFEVIREVQVFPEALAPQYGYPPDRRVVNFILRQDYKALTLLARLPLPNGDGRDTYRARGNLVRIDPGGRWSVDLEYRREDAVLEAPLAGAPTGRTLLPENDRLTLNSVISRALPKATATLNGRLQFDRSEGDYSRPGAGGSEVVFDRRVERQALHGGGGLNGDGAAFRWSLTGAFDAGEEKVRSAAGAMAPLLTPATVAWLGPDRTATTREASAELLLTSQVPGTAAGPGAFALKASVSGRSREERFILPGGEARTQARASAFANLDAPLIETGAAPGRLSINGALGIEGVSRFRPLTTVGAGLRWTPWAGATLSASASRQKVAPDPAQLASGALPAFNVRIFDFRTDQGREAVRFEGGAPGLGVETRDAATLRFQVKPLSGADLTLAADYSWRRGRDAMSGPLGVSPQIEDAFPDRFARDAAGRLTSFDARPLNFARTERRQVRWGLNLYRVFAGGGPRATAGEDDGFEDEELGPTTSDDPLIAPTATPRGAHLRLALYHTWRLQDEVTARAGGPTIDLLDGGAVGSRGGEPTHQVEVQFGGEYRAVSGRLAAVWRGETDVQGLNGWGAPTRLTFSDSTRLDARIIVDLAALPIHERYPWVRGKLNISVENLLGAQSEATDLNGVTPFGYGRRQLNPEGRALRITLRKRFRTS